jgi:hypothetical protein
MLNYVILLVSFRCRLDNCPLVGVLRWRTGSTAGKELGEHRLSCSTPGPCPIHLRLFLALFFRAQAKFTVGKTLARSIGVSLQLRLGGSRIGEHLMVRIRFLHILFIQNRNTQKSLDISSVKNILVRLLRFPDYYFYSREICLDHLSRRSLVYILGGRLICTNNYLRSRAGLLQRRGH